MNEIVNRFLLVGDKFISEMHLRRLGFTYSVCWPFNKSKERILKFQETGNPRYIYQHRVEKTCFQHDMTYGDFKKLPRRTASDKVLRNEAFNIAENPNYDRCQRGFASVVYNFLHKKYSGGTVKSEIMPNQQLAEGLPKPIITNSRNCFLE